MITPLFSKSEYAKRRDFLAGALDSHRDLVVLFTAPFRYRNHDSSYRFRPDSSFYYFTGFAEHDAVTFIWKENKKTRYQLFVLPRNKEREQWDGYRWGEKPAAKEFGANEAFQISKFEKQLLEHLSTVPLKGQHPRIWTNAMAYPECKKMLEGALDKFQPPHRSGIKPIEAIVDVRARTGQSRLIKSPAEIAIMKRAGEINVKAHLKVLEALKPGLMEYELQAICEHEYHVNGCMDPAYTSICAGGRNATILHYIENNERLKSGDLFLIDAGCEHHFYASDITRTYPINGKYSKEQRILMDLVSEAHAETLALVKPGLPYAKMHERATEVLVEGLIKLRFLHGKRDQVIKSLKHKQYYPHGTGHHLGHDVHDECPYFDEKGESLKLEAGMVFTIEPGLYFLRGDTSVPSQWRGLGVRLEDDIVVTSKGAALLTEGLPRSADEVETYMARGRA